jgi:transposase
MKEKSTNVKRRKYDASFKEEVLRMVLNGRPVNEVAQSLGIGENLIYKWKSCRSQQPAAVGKGDNATGISEDQQALLKRIRELEQERDILKKPWAFSAGSDKTIVQLHRSSYRPVCSTGIVPDAWGQP